MSAHRSSAAMPIVIAEWTRNTRETIRVSLTVYNGTPVVDLRTWYSAGSEMKPGRAGITLGLDHLSRLADGLSAALREATKRGLL
jgi:hypothetical protein